MYLLGKTIDSVSCLLALVNKLKQVKKGSPVTCAQMNFLLCSLAVKSMPVLCCHTNKHNILPLTKTPVLTSR